MSKNDTLNSLSGIVTLPVTSGKDTLTAPVPEGMCMIKDGMLLIASRPGLHMSNMEDHRHPNLSLATHTHTVSDNNPWMMCNPQLWYYPDVKNHPELIVLNGQELDEESAKNISKYYYGNRTLTEPVEFRGGSFENTEVVLTVSTYTGLNTPDKLFGPDVDITNGFNFDDQWLTGDGDLQAEQKVEITFKGSIKYLPKAYRMVPASGTPLAEVRKAPSPKNWVVEGLVGEDWVELDKRENITEWTLLTPVDFDIKTEQLVTAMRLRITEWNAGATVENGTLATGLRRFYVFGRKEGKFSVPDIKSPDEEFVWVIPKDNLNIGLKHEDVGDIGVALAGSTLPAYRKWCTGEYLDANIYPLLDNVLRGKFDKENTVTESTTEGTATKYTVARSEVLSGYTFTLTPSKKKPVSWTLVGINDSGTTTVLHTVTNLQGVVVDDTTYSMQVDNNKIAYAKYQLTISAWSEEGTGEEITPQFYTHPTGKITLPHFAPQDNLAYYIVADLCVTDVSAEVIAALQKNVVDLATTCSKLQEQINKLQGSPVRRRLFF